MSYDVCICVYLWITRDLSFWKIGIWKIYSSDMDLSNVHKKNILSCFNFRKLTDLKLIMWWYKGGRRHKCYVYKTHICRMNIYHICTLLILMWICIISSFTRISIELFGRVRVRIWFPYWTSSYNFFFVFAILMELWEKVFVVILKDANTCVYVCMETLGIFTCCDAIQFYAISPPLGTNGVFSLIKQSDP